jgi:hypothetical protein
MDVAAVVREKRDIVGIRSQGEDRKSLVTPELL